MSSATGRDWGGPSVPVRKKRRKGPGYFSRSKKAHKPGGSFVVVSRSCIDNSFLYSTVLASFFISPSILLLPHGPSIPHLSLLPSFSPPLLAALLASFFSRTTYLLSPSTVRLVIFLCARDVSGTLVACPRATAVPESTTRTNIKPETAIRRSEYGSSPRTHPLTRETHASLLNQLRNHPSTPGSRLSSSLSPGSESSFPFLIHSLSFSRSLSLPHCSRCVTVTLTIRGKYDLRLIPSSARAHTSLW